MTSAELEKRIETTQKQPLHEVSVQVKRLPHFRGDLPYYQTTHASGFDVRAQLEEDILLSPSQRVLVPTGLAFGIPQGYEIQVRPRSGWAAREGLTVLNTPGTIDADYRGEVKVILINLGSSQIKIKNQDRIAQFVLCPVFISRLQEVSTLSETSRGVGGFGSTGK